MKTKKLWRIDNKSDNVSFINVALNRFVFDAETIMKLIAKLTVSLDYIRKSNGRAFAHGRDVVMKILEE